MAVTWNPSDKSSYIALSNGNLTATRQPPNSHGAVRATEGKSSGKWYWEISIGSIGAGSCYIGIATALKSLTTYLGVSAEGWGFCNNFAFWHDGSFNYLSDGYSDGEIVGVALDLDNGKLWYSVDGAWLSSGNPATGASPAATGISGKVYPCVSLYYYNNNITAAFNTDDMTYSPPAGFSGLEGGSESVELSDISLNLSAYHQSADDLKTWLKAHDGLEFEDIALALQTGVISLNDLKTTLSAYYQTQDDVKLSLETLGRCLSDFPLALEAYGRALSDLRLPLSTVGNFRSDLPMLLEAVSPTVLNDIAMLLSVTDGSALNDLNLQLNAIRQAPQFRSSIAQRLSSVISEVV